MQPAVRLLRRYSSASQSFPVPTPPNSPEPKLKPICLESIQPFCCLAFAKSAPGRSSYLWDLAAPYRNRVHKLFAFSSRLFAELAKTRYPEVRVGSVERLLGGYAIVVTGDGDGDIYVPLLDVKGKETVSFFRIREGTRWQWLSKWEVKNKFVDVGLRQRYQCPGKACGGREYEISFLVRKDREWEMEIDDFDDQNDREAITAVKDSLASLRNWPVMEVATALKFGGSPSAAEAHLREKYATELGQLHDNGDWDIVPERVATDLEKVQEDGDWDVLPECVMRI